MSYKSIERIMMVLFCTLTMVFACQNALAQSETEAASENVEAVSSDTYVTEESEGFDAGPFIIEHVIDSYGWHICGDGDKSVTIPLPVILFDGGHPTVFMSSKLHHGEAAYNGYAMGWGDNKGRIVKLDGDYADYTGHLEEGVTYPNHVCKWDISITKNVCALLISLVLICCIFLTVAKRYKQHPDEAPRGLQALVEPVIVFIQDEVITPSLGKNSNKYAPYLLTLFFFIFLNNMLGIIPIFPGGANEDSAADHAVGGDHRYLHEAVRVDGATLRQHHRRSHHHLGVRFADLHFRADEPGHRLGSIAGLRLLLHLHGSDGAVGSVHPGVRLHPAQRDVHWHGHRRGTRRARSERGCRRSLIHCKPF